MEIFIISFRVDNRHLLATIPQTDQKAGAQMKITEIAELLKATLHYIPEDFDGDIVHAGASDLMSDVLAYVAQDILLITGLLSRQVIRTADMMDISAVLFTRGKVPGEDILIAAKETNIAVLSTEMKTFSSCALLYNGGIRSIDADGG